MGFLFHIVLALGALGLAEVGLDTGWRAPWGLLLAGGIPHALGAVARRLFVHGRFRASGMVAGLLGKSGPFLFLAALTVFGWEGTIGTWVGHEVSFVNWPEPAMFLVLAPFVVYEMLAIDARSRAFGAAAELRSWRNFQARMFLSSLLPILAYIGIASAVGFSDELRVRIEEVTLYNALFAGVVLLVLALLLPTMLRNTLETVPLAPGMQRDLLLGVARRAGFKARALLVWRTGHTMANAAIIGIGGRSRVVLFSDSLLMQLDLRELAAVFAHEMGHAFRHHVTIFVMWALGFFLAADLVANWVFSEDPWLAGGLVLALMCLGYVALGFMSRRFELDADLFSLDLLGDHEALIGALEKVGGRFRDVASWRHFSTGRRVVFLRRAALDPAVGRRLRKSLRRWTWAGLALLALSASVQVRGLLRELPQDEIRANLRLGHYAAALERTQGDGDVDPETAALVKRAQGLGLAECGVEALEREAHAALRRKDVEAALEWLELARLRGRSDLALVEEVLRAMIGDPSADPKAMGEELFGAWSADIEAWRS